jgi:hypothetical protein
MTGKELIIYILQNNLEDKVVLSNGIFTGIMDAEQAAAKFGVGVATVQTWYQLGMIPGFTMGGSLFFMKDVENPLLDKNKRGVDRNG